MIIGFIATESAIKKHVLEDYRTIAILITYSFLVYLPNKIDHVWCNDCLHGYTVTRGVDLWPTPRMGQRPKHETESTELGIMSYYSLRIFSHHWLVNSLGNIVPKNVV